MYPIETIKTLNNRPNVRRDNFNRNSSACSSRSGVVIHSGIHRSTAFVSRRDAVASLQWARDLGQDALNGWVEATIDGAELEACELNAIARAFPAWKFYRYTSKTAEFVCGSCKVGKFETRISARAWQELASKLMQHYKITNPLLTINKKRGCMLKQ